MNSFFSKYYRHLFLNRALFAGLSVCVFLFVLSFFFPWLGDIPTLATVVIFLLFFADILLLFRIEEGIIARRSTPERLSNSDDNKLVIYLESFYAFGIRVGIIDEIPFQFQKRDLWMTATLKSRQHKLVEYRLKPLKRGEYEFGNLHVYVRSPLGLISRRYTFEQSVTVPVYPSFLQMRKYELMAISNRLNELGVKKIRRLGHSMEFDQVKNYVGGDDYRTINWRATARRGELMVNSYTDERSQHVYCVIDKSRAMKMPFGGLSLLDYAINASLVLSDIAVIKDDRAGLITASEKIGSVVPADKGSKQVKKIMEVLYREKTRYLEINMEAVYSTIRATARQRSLVVFFTNYESMSALHRHLPFLKKIARFHLLLVVFFENTELKRLIDEPAKNTEEIYIKTVAEKFAFEKRQIVRELAQHGIQAILTTPDNLTVNTINRYLEIKAHQRI